VDNVTHSLAGLVLAESAVRLRAGATGAEPSPRFRAFAATSSVIAANLLDADLLYTGVGGDPLAYLLHHRGHTHTVVFALLGAVLLWAVVWMGLRWRTKGAASAEDARWLFGLMLVSTVGHLVLDWTNSYGVHPFWPFDNEWRYGDAVFIVEPWLWVVSIPTLVIAAQSRVGRGVLSLILLVGLALAWRVDMVTRGAAIAVSAGAVASIALARVLRPGARVAAAVAAWVAVTAVMWIGSAMSRGRVTAAVRDLDPRTELLDVVITPLPANPVCTSVIAVERSGATYRVVTARVSTAPAVTPVSNCRTRDGSPMLTPSTRPSSANIEWDGEWSAPAAELIELARESCPARAGLRFLRAPIWRPLGSSTVLLGDVRYGGGSGSSFSDLIVPRRSEVCPAPVPPWTPPRSDLLEGK
jgi:inner membrane protein